MMNWKRISVLAVGFYFVFSTGSAASQWFHVRVHEPGGESVKINLPLNLISTLVPMVEEEDLSHGTLRVKDQEITVAELREIWVAVKAEGNDEFVTVESDNQRVRITKEGDQLFIRSVEGSETEVEVNVPVSVVDALLAGDGETLNIKAAIDALALAPPGDLVRVKDGKTHVRIWIDAMSSPE
jgi:hypothetical protein